MPRPDDLAMAGEASCRASRTGDFEGIAGAKVAES